MVNKIDGKSLSRAQALGEALHRLMHRLRHASAPPGPGPELPHMASRALGFFVREPGATAAQLVDHSGRDKAQIARLVGQLQAQGLLEARVDPQDGRVRRLYPSAQAAAVYDAQAQARAHHLADVLGVLDEQEQQQLLALLRKLDPGGG